MSENLEQSVRRIADALNEIEMLKGAECAESAAGTIAISAEAISLHERVKKAVEPDEDPRT